MLAMLVASYELRFARYGFRVAGYGLRVARYEADFTTKTRNQESTKFIVSAFSRFRD